MAAGYVSTPLNGTRSQSSVSTAIRLTTVAASFPAQHRIPYQNRVSLESVDGIEPSESRWDIGGSWVSQRSMWGCRPE